MEDVGRAWIGRPPRANTCCRHRDVAEETTAVDNSVDPSSPAHAEACSAIVERVDVELGALPPPLADCESTSRVFAFGNGDTRDKLRRACQGRDSWRDWFFCLWLGGLWPIREFSGFSRDEKVQKIPASLISSELSAHQMALGGVIAH